MSQRATLLEGSLEDIELANVVQTVSVSRRSVALELREPGGAVFGTLVLKAGQVVSAVSEGISGLEALRKLVAVRRPGRFLVYRASGVDLREHLGPVADLLGSVLASGDSGGALARGNLDQLPLRAVLEALSLSRQRVTLTVFAGDDGRLGALTLKGGQVLSASWGHDTGEPAARALLEARADGRFAVSRAAGAPPGEPLISVRALLRPQAREESPLEVGDEDLAEADAEEMPVTHVSPRPTPSQPPPLPTRPPPLPSQRPPGAGAASVPPGAPAGVRDAAAGLAPLSARPGPPGAQPPLPLGYDPVWPLASASLPISAAPPRVPSTPPDPMLRREIPGGRTEPRASAPWPDAPRAPAAEQPHLLVHPKVRSAPPPVPSEAPRSVEALEPGAREGETRAANEAPRPAAGEAPRPAADEATRPAADEATRPAADEAPRPAADEAPRPAAGEAPRPAADEAPRPAADEATPTRAAEATRPAVEKGNTAPDAGPARAASASRSPRRVNGDAVAPAAPSLAPAAAPDAAARDSASGAADRRPQSEPRQALHLGADAPAARAQSEMPSALGPAPAPSAAPWQAPARSAPSAPPGPAVRERASDASITARYPAARGGAPIVAVTSPKGGAGRSTLALNLAVSLARRGRRVVLVDADASDLLPTLDVADRAYKGVADALEGWAPLADTVLDTRVPGLKLIPSGELSDETYRHPGWQPLLTTLAQQADLVLVDCAPGWYGATPSVLEAATHQLLVLAAEPAARRICTAYQARLQKLLKARAKPELLGVVINMLDYQVHASVRALEELANSEFARHVFDVPIPRSPTFMEASARGVPIVHAEGAASTVAWVFETLATALLERLQLERPALAAAPLLI